MASPLTAPHLTQILDSQRHESDSPGFSPQVAHERVPQMHGELDAAVISNGRTFTQQVTDGLAKVWETIKKIADFVFNIVLLGIVYRVPKAILYDLPCLLTDVRTGVEEVKKLQPVIQQLQPLVPMLVDMAQQCQDPVNRQIISGARDALGVLVGVVQDAENQTVARNARDVLGTVVGPANRETRERVAVVVHDLLAYAVTDAAEDCGKARSTLHSVAQRVDQTKGMSVFGALRHKPTGGGGSAPAVRRMSAEGMDSDVEGEESVGGERPATPGMSFLGLNLFGGSPKPKPPADPMAASGGAGGTPPPAKKPAALGGGVVPTPAGVPARS